MALPTALKKDKMLADQMECEMVSRLAVMTAVQKDDYWDAQWAA